MSGGCNLATFSQSEPGGSLLGGPCPVTWNALENNSSFFLAVSIED